MDDTTALPQPFATLHDDGYWTMPPGKVPHAANYAGWRQPVYSAEQLRAYGAACRAAALAEAARICDDVDEPMWYGYENPNTFHDGARACGAAILAKTAT